jgi:hypothetical protein
MTYFSTSPNLKHLIIVLGLMVHSDVTNKDNSSKTDPVRNWYNHTEVQQEISTLYQTLSLHATTTQFYAPPNFITYFVNNHLQTISHPLSSYSKADFWEVMQPISCVYSFFSFLTIYPS